MAFKKKIPTRKKKTSKLVLVRDIKSGHDILMPLSTIKNSSPEEVTALITGAIEEA